VPASGKARRSADPPGMAHRGILVSKERMEAIIETLEIMAIPKQWKATRDLRSREGADEGCFLP